MRSRDGQPPTGGVGKDSVWAECDGLVEVLSVHTRCRQQRLIAASDMKQEEGGEVGQPSQGRAGPGDRGLDPGAAQVQPTQPETGQDEGHVGQSGIPSGEQELRGHTDRFGDEVDQGVVVRR